jgi:hypothetical protein
VAGTSLRALAPSNGDVAARGYARRRPEHTVLHAVVREHLPDFLRETRDQADRGLPRYVERELRGYLRCGLLKHGYVRAECRECGRELLVAFSCKLRGICPSCNARRMCNTAAHLVDRVFPAVPVRQWVLSLPFELRLLLARRADAFGALIRIFASEVTRLQRERARTMGLLDASVGGVSFPQRFGGSLNLNTHVHSVFADGVYTFEDGIGRFHALPGPETEALSAVCERVAMRLHRWLRKRDLVRDDDQEPFPEREGTDALDGCTEGALGVGELGRVDDDAEEPPDEFEMLPQPKPGRRSRYVGEAAGYHLHAGVAVPAHNALGRELLFRYCARPPFALERLSVLPDGRVAYRIKKPWRPGQTHRLMTPLEFLARLAALVPPPRFPLVRFHGVFAPHSKQRVLVVPGKTPRRLERERSRLAHVHDGHGEGKDTRQVTPSGTSDQRPAAKASASCGAAEASDRRANKAIGTPSAS